MNVQRAGFTLIEMLVAIAILAVIAGVLVMTAASSGTDPRLRLEAERLQARIDLACERAELTGRDIGLHIGTDMYGFSQRRGDQIEMQTKAPLAPYTLPKDMALNVPDSELATGLGNKPQMSCFSSGERTPLTLILEAGSRDPRYRLLIDAAGTSHIQRQLPAQTQWQDWSPRA